MQRPVVPAWVVTLSARVWIEIIIDMNRDIVIYVTLSARVWIEIGIYTGRTVSGIVTLSARVWIEITSFNT